MTFCSLIHRWFCCRKYPEQASVRQSLRTSRPIPSALGLDGIALYCEVDHVYDGDTLTLRIPIQYHLSSFRKQEKGESLPPEYTEYPFILARVRLAGIDTPELRTKDEVEKQGAIAAKKYLEQLCAQTKPKKNRPFVVFGKQDKYGRPLADLYATSNLKEERSFSTQLIQANLGYAYHGGTKKSSEGSV